MNAFEPRGHTSFNTSTLGPRVGFYAASAEALPGGLVVVRTEARDGRRFRPRRRAPLADGQVPAPFSDHATYREGRGASSPHWSGPLAVDFPGVIMQLAGPSFKALLRLAK